LRQVNGTVNPNSKALDENGAVSRGFSRQGDPEEAERENQRFTQPATERKVIQQVISALACMHAAGTIHCGIKPENLNAEPTWPL